MQRTKKLEENKIKTREQNKGRKSKRCCRRQFTWLIIALLSNRYRSAIAPLSLRYHSTIAPLSPRYRYAVTLLSLLSHNTIAPLLFRCRYSAVAPLSRSCHTNITPVSLHCRSAAVAPAVATQSHRYVTAVALLSNNNRSGPERV